MSKASFSLLVVLLLFMPACDDLGDPVTPPITPSNAPVITAVVPDSGAVGDTVTIIGSKFGTAQGSSTVQFGSVAATPVGSWSDTAVKVTVPASAATSALTITVNGAVSNGKTFTVAGTSGISFANDIVPLLNGKGCTGCHGGSGGLTVLPHSSLLMGNSDHGPVITVGNGEGSVLVRKLRGTAGFGSRMPQGASPLSESEIQKFVQWINQGALNN